MKSSKFLIPCAFLALAGCNESISCDNPQVLKQVKHMIYLRLIGNADYLIQRSDLRRAFYEDQSGPNWTKLSLDFQGIRDRGSSRSGSSDCAAIGKLSKPETGYSESLGVSYMIERDTAGEHVLTVRVARS